MFGRKVELVGAHGLGMDDSGAKIRSRFATPRLFHGFEQHVRSGVPVGVHLRLNIAGITTLQPQIDFFLGHIGITAMPFSRLGRITAAA